MGSDLPTLKGLRAFEEAYRLRSFTAAAASLNVQQPAISYQIKCLEEDLGVILFDRKNGRPKPTPKAHELFETLSQAFDAIRETSNQLRSSSPSSSFTIVTYPGIGTYWLSNRLPFLSEDLNRSVKLVTLKRDEDLWQESADCWIAFGHGHWPGKDARLLFKEEVCPVAAPELAAQIFDSHLSIGTETTKIIELDDPEKRWLGWDAWFQKRVKVAQTSNKRIVVNDHGLAMHMTLAGSGVALAWLGVVDDLLSGGSLVRLSTQTLTSDAGYWLVGERGFFDTTRGNTVLESLVPGAHLDVAAIDVCDPE
ncbi:LysR family transcriptional regulator [Pelagimonas varians]|uniref:Glycine cleavage system transcriptional activator n=2 Tax=Pelagimonas varians TaxID=696760 RepID=A0A238KSX7_9RHOB|nr:LysR family transcriptional regulator [Pelagimonas varians]SMX45828.1 Glycine cleavage system transcriptional activator [Pelagimonas varians]